MMAQIPTENRYTQLDGLRASAVFLVIISHWFPASYLVNRYTPNGEIGVNLFFVLSGFLISEILIRAKDKMLLGQATTFSVYRSFFFRRALRIFPIYYLTIFILRVLPQSPMQFKQNFIYYFSYTTNVYFYRIKHWNFGAHLWTLAVEEQFYIVWPFVILLTPYKYMFKVFLGFILLGVISKFIFPVTDTPLTAILTPACFDSFGMGAILALAKNKFNADRYIIFEKTTGIIALMSVTVWIGFIITNVPMHISVLRIFISTIASYLIMRSIKQFEGPIGSFLENGVVTYIGKISYGLYLYHAFIPWINETIVFKKIPALAFLPTQVELYFLYNLVWLILIASLSWYLMESKFNGLKKYFALK